MIDFLRQVRLASRTKALRSNPGNVSTIRRRRNERLSLVSAIASRALQAIDLSVLRSEGDCHIAQPLFQKIVGPNYDKRFPSRRLKFPPQMPG